MCAALGGMLSVYKGVIYFPVLAAMGQGQFNILILQLNDRIQAVAVYILAQQINQSVLGENRDCRSDKW